MPTTQALRKILPIVSLVESTELGAQSQRLTNLMLRPEGGFKGPPLYNRLFGLGASTAMASIVRALPFTGYPGGIGADAPARAANKTCAIRLACQGKNFIYLYDLVNSKLRGLDYMGDDGTGPANPDFTSGTVTWTVLAVGLDSAARWYFHRAYSQLFAGNGQDANVCIQLARTATPGIWRAAGSNVAPAAPVIAAITPAASALTQASWAIPQWGGPTGKTLTFLADEDNFPGVSGNDKIRVRITPSVGSLASTLGGSGIPSTDPYAYAITGGSVTVGSATTGPTPEAVATFVNGDTKILSILHATVSASGSSLPDTTARGPTLLTGGTGTGTSTGFTNRTATVLARYWDPGQENLGYEGISSDPSNSLVIPASANNDIRVLVPVDASAEGGRFPFIRIYLNFEDTASGEEIFSLMNPDDPIPNGLTGAVGAVSTSQDDVVLPSSQFAENDVVRFTTTGTLPAPLVAGTDYYLRPKTSGTANAWRLSTTVGGTALNLTTTGTGTHTVTLQKKCVVLGTNSAIGTAMAEDQNRPLPHTQHAIAGRQTWRAGVTGNQDRLYVSKEATPDEIAPEGANAEDYASVQSTKSAAGSDRVTALYSTENSLHLHTETGIIIINPADTDDRREPEVAVGAINGASLTTLPDRSVWYLGSDVSLMRFDAALQYDQIIGTAAAANSNAIHYLRARVSSNDLAANPDRATLFVDTPAQMLWFFLPALDGSLIGFAYDLKLQGLVGEFTFPKVYAACRMEKQRPEIIFGDEDGNLFVWDTVNQPAQGDAFPEVPAFTPHSTSTPPPVGDNGFGYVDWGGSRYYRATTSILETGFFDLGSTDQRKAFLRAVFRTVQNSRALVRVTFTALNGQTLTRDIGDVALDGNGVDHPVLMALSSSALKMQFEILTAEQRPWIIRDLAFLFSKQGPST